MPKRWDIRAIAVKATVIAVGTVVAAGTLHHTRYVDQTPLVARVAAGDSIAKQRLSSLGVASAAPAAAAARLSPNTLDAGIDHSRIDYWVNRLTTSMKDGFSVALGRKDKYDDMITSKLEAKGLPKDLVYLAMIESEFNPNAKSPVKAVGLWQFMSGTAKRFGLAVGRHVDERKDPAKSTDAAAEYLSSLHDRFGSWYLAAAAYNSGEGTVLKAMKRVLGRTTGDDEDFFRIMPSLPKETQDYVPKLIAAARVGNAPAQYGITPTAPVAAVQKAAVPRRAKQSRTIASARRVHKAVKPRSAHRRSSHR